MGFNDIFCDFVGSHSETTDTFREKSETGLEFLSVCGQEHPPSEPISHHEASRAPAQGARLFRTVSNQTLRTAGSRCLACTNRRQPLAAAAPTAAVLRHFRRFGRDSVRYSLVNAPSPHPRTTVYDYLLLSEQQRMQAYVATGWCL